MDSQIAAEANKFKYQWEKERTLEELNTNVKTPATEAAKELEKLMKVKARIKDFTGKEYLALDADYFTVNSLKLGLKSGLKKVVIDLFTIYLNEGVRKEAYQLAVEILERTEKLKEIIPTNMGVFAVPSLPNPSGFGFVPGSRGLLTVYAGKLIINETEFSNI